MHILSLPAHLLVTNIFLMAYFATLFELQND